MTTEDDDLMKKLAQIEETIRASEGEGIQARWEFGHEVLKKRGEDKKLPPGLTAEICDNAKITQQELSNRVRFAEAYDESRFTTEVVNAGLTWTAIRNALPPKRSGPRKPSKPRSAPTAATIKEADRVEELLTHPDVVDELRVRDKTRETTRRAQAVIERKERMEARQQKDEDRFRQEVLAALRQQMVHGDRNWENLTEQAEILTDTFKRYLDAMEGLTRPDDLRLKRLDSQLGQLQQRVLELRGWLWPDYRTSREEIGRTRVINV